MAVVWLAERGYHILHQNWRHSKWEVDIIAHKEKRLHVIEVKTRSSDIFGKPEENMDAKKMQYLINAAEEYMYQYPHWQQLQFDILAINIRKSGVEYFLIEDVYL